MPLSLVSVWSTENDSRFVVKNLPFLKGNGSESRSCGKCGRLIVENVTIRVLYANLQGYKRVIVSCPCGADNVLVEERRKQAR